jgi:hypothetical protein
MAAAAASRKNNDFFIQLSSYHSQLMFSDSVKSSDEVLVRLSQMIRTGLYSAASAYGLMYCLIF